MYAPHGRVRYPESLKLCAAEGQSGRFSRIVNAHFTTLVYSPRRPVAATCRTHAAQRRAGFTLPEVISALTVLVVGAFAVFSLVTLSIQSDAESAHISQARAAAQQQLEWARQNGAASIAATPTIPTTALPPGATVSFTTAATSITGLTDATVTINWTEPGRGQESVTLETYVATGGLN